MNTPNLTRSRLSAYIQFTVRAVLISVLIGYSYLVYQSLNGHWFNPKFTNGDARQQLFPLYDALDPEIFRGDLIYTSMRAYLAPLHYWLSYGITLLTENPVQTGHWVTLIQLVPTLVFIFMLLYRIAGIEAALVGLIWFLHSRNVIFSMSAGLPRGWFPPLIAAIAYFASQRKHIAANATLLIGSLLNAPATFLTTAVYAIFLGLELLGSKFSPQSRKACLMFALFLPLLVGTAVVALKRPPEIGKMIDFETASTMPAYQRGGGRFGFLPFESPVEEIKRTAFRALVTKWNSSAHWGVEAELLRDVAASIIFALLLSTLIYQFRSKRELIPNELLALLIAIPACYFASRWLAFRLYVPSRYLGVPAAMFFILAVPVIVRRMANGASSNRGRIALIALLGVVFLLGGSGLSGGSGFCPQPSQAGLPIYRWLRERTAKTAVILSHPNAIDGIQLYGVRRGFITTETAHPFYDAYYQEAERRIKISLDAIYAPDRLAFLKAVSQDKVDYVFFPRSFFKPNKSGKGINLKKALMFKPLNELVMEHTKRDPAEYWYADLKRNSTSLPFVVYSSKGDIVVDVKALKADM